MGCEALELDLELGTAQSLAIGSFTPIRLFMTTFLPWTMMIKAANPPPTFSLMRLLLS